LRRFERLTFTFGGCHSIQLSYRDAGYPEQDFAGSYSVNHFWDVSDSYKTGSRVKSPQQTASRFGGCPDSP
ncbi:MAG TPA: hypothetical protein PLN88_04930, partial [Candidatus Cloacimonadota bacterium]|nr:hypothetical protein [Candidatus Cloacimonadota bacterium]